MDESVVKNFEQSQITVKLSQAIRIGARLRLQCRGALFAHGRSCALGAAYEALFFGKAAATTVMEKLRQTYPFAASSYLLYEIMGKNDRDGWTREQIADWLEARGF